MEELYCWNCRKEVATEGGYVEYVRLQLSEKIWRPVDVTYCAECNAILYPKRKYCDTCGKYRRVFHVEVHLHGSSTFVPLCKTCVAGVYEEIVSRMEETGNK